MDDNNNDKNNFKFAAALIKIITFAIAILLVSISKYAAIFFSAAMLPTIIALFFDRNAHKCASATICTFNLIGAMPYLMKLWDSNYIDDAAKSIIANVDTWMIIYGAAFIGQLLYMSIPLLIIRLHIAKSKVQANALEKRCKQISEEWGIKPTEESDIKTDAANI